MRKSIFGAFLAGIVFASPAFAEVSQTSGTGADFARACKKPGNACAHTGSGGGIDTYTACTNSQCYEVSCSSEQPDRTCIKEESPNRRIAKTKKGLRIISNFLGVSLQNSSVMPEGSGNDRPANSGNADSGGPNGADSGGPNGDGSPAVN